MRAEGRLTNLCCVKDMNDVTVRSSVCGEKCETRQKFHSNSCNRWDSLNGNYFSFVKFVSTLDTDPGDFGGVRAQNERLNENETTMHS